jgi:tRNA(fMet)-specific endonuclease VapC
MVSFDGLALDSNIAIAILNEDARVIKQLQDVLTFFLPITVCGELLFGAKNSSRSTGNEQKCWTLIDRCEIINTNLLIAEEYAIIRKELKEKGRPIPENDIWIAAACRANQLPLATRDKHFQYIDELELVDF